MSVRSNAINRLAAIPFLDKMVDITSGKIFWVQGTIGSDDNSGISPSEPLATWDAAVGKCTSNKGDVIYLMPGHTETVSAAAGINNDVAGVSVIGLGNGTNRPLITVGTATTADIDINAANVLIKNIQFTSAIDSLENFITVGANNFTIEDCYFYTASTFEAVCFINLETTFDNFVIRGCTFKQPTDPAGTDAAAGTGCIYCVDSENILIEDCFFWGEFETAFVHNKTTACKQLWIRNCRGTQDLSTGQILLLVAGATGGIDSTLFIATDAATATESELTGIIGDAFFIGATYSAGNDGAGGQLALRGGSDSAAVS